MKTPIEKITIEFDLDIDKMGITGMPICPRCGNIHTICTSMSLFRTQLLIDCPKCGKNFMHR